MEQLLVERYSGERVDKMHSGGGVTRNWLADAGEEQTALCEERGGHHEIPLVNPTVKVAGRGFDAYYTPEIVTAVRPVFAEF